MHMNLRVIAATIAVAAATFLFSLVAPPLLSLVPSDTAHAQEGPSIEIEFNPGFVVRDNEELNFTLTFSGISGMTGLTYDATVARIGEPNAEECEGAGTGNDMALGSISGDTATATGTIPATCPPYFSYALIVKLFDSSDDELITVASPFKVSPFMKLVLPEDNKPTSPAGLWSEEFGDYSVVRFHVVDSASNKVYMYDLGTEEHGFRKDYVTFEGTYDLAGTDSPWGITSNAATTWVTNDGSATTDEVFAYSNANRSDRITDDEFTLDSSNTAPRGAVDYTINPDLHFMYVVDNSADKVFFYIRDRDPRSGSSTSTFTHVPDQDYVLDAENTDPAGLWLTGWLMYVSDSHADKVFAYEMEHVDSSQKAVRMPEYDIDDLDQVGNSDPAGITSDERFVYVLDSVDKAIYAYEYPDVPFEPVTIKGASIVTVPENSTTTDEKYYAMDPNATSGTKSNVGLFRTLTDDRIFKLEHLGSSDENGLIRIYDDFELVFWDSPLDCSTDPDFEDPKDVDKDNVYELILTGGNRGFPHSYFPVTVTITNIEHESPCFPGTSTTRYIPESAGFGYKINPAFRALQRDDDPNKYSLSGTDAAEFQITNSGYLKKNSTTTLDFSATPTYSVVVHVRDDRDDQGNANTSTDDSIDVSVKVVKAPVISGATSTTFAENGTEDVSTFTATNGGWPPITWSLEGHDADDFTIASTTEGGTLRFVKPPDFERPVGRAGRNEYVIRVVASDGYQQTGHDFTVTVTDVNDPPVFPDGSSTAREVDEGTAAGEPVGAPITATDQDRPKDTLTYSLSGTDASSFDFSTSTGQILTKVALDFATKDMYSVTVGVSDGGGGTASIDVTINVLSVNAPPDLSGTTTVGYQENGNGQVARYTATDPEGQATIRWGLSGTNADAFNIQSGVLSFKSSPDYEETQTYSVTVEASDGNSTSTLDVTVNIINIDEPPVVTGSATVEFAENDSGVVARYEDNDPEGGPVDWSLSGNGADDMNISGGSLYFNNPPDHETKPVVHITVQASDGNSTSTLPVTINITDVNEDPGFSESDNAQRSVDENTPANRPVGAPVTATDPDDGARLTYSLRSSPDSEHFDIDSSTGQIKTKLALDTEIRPTYYVDVDVHDGKDADGNPSTTADATIFVTITVTDVNEPPVITEATSTDFAENSAQTVGIFSATDPEGETTFTWTLSGTDSDAFSITDGTLSFKQAPNYEQKTTYDVTVQATDSGNLTGRHDFVVNITNEDDDGTISFSPIHPQAGKQFTATLSDPDTVVSNSESWAWATSTATSGPWNVISGATSNTYTPGDDDEGKYLQVTVSYEDGLGTGKSAVGVPGSAVLEAAIINTPPAFDQPITRFVPENTDTGQNIGPPVTAKDTEDTALVYSLGGPDADSFDIATSTGQLKTKAPLDREATSTYSVLVQVSDGRDPRGNADDESDASIDVTINVSDVNESPEVSGDSTTTFAENATGTVATFTATDPEGQKTFIWTLSGDDSNDFDISAGELTFTSPPNFEAAVDSNADNDYAVTVQASDGTETGTHDIVVTITDVDEDGTLTLSNNHPQIGTELRVTLSDPDVSLSDIAWTWERASTSTDDWAEVSTTTAGTATTNAYTPVTADEGMRLRVAANYTDKHSSGKRVVKEFPNAVIPAPVVNHQPTFTSNTETRNVPENSDVGTPIGDPVAANDLNGNEGLVYTLDGTDETSFDIDSATGQLKTKTMLNYESKSSYSVEVIATDPSNLKATTRVTITVDDVNESPTVDGPTDVNYPENGTRAVGTYRATDPERRSVVLTVGGTDGTHFRMNGNKLNFNAPPDFETPGDSGNDNVYNLKVIADDRNSTASIDVTVTITKANEGPEFPNSDTRTRSVPENTPAGQNVGAPVSASGPESDSLTYTLSGSNAGSFDINASTGQILTKAPLNYESKRSYSVRVSVTDSKKPDGSSSSAIDDRIDITVNVTGEDEAPEITGATSTNFAENSTRAVASYTGRDPEGGSVQWTVRGTDSAYFAITNSGVLSFDPAPDYEDAKDSDSNNVYHATVQASDGNNIRWLGVTVTVTNVEEIGTVELSSVQPQVNTELTATLDDPDEITSTVTWSWQRSRTGSKSNWSNITGATSDSYTASSTDVGKYLRVTARYNDGFSDGKIASAVSANPVREVPEDNVPPRYSGTQTTRSVLENAPAGTNVGDPVIATDNNQNDRLTYRLGGTDATMFRIRASTGQIQTAVPMDHESDSSYTVTVKAVDPSSASSTITVNISVTDVDEPPVAVDDAATTTEDGSAVTINVLANDSDPEGLQLTLISVTQPANGSAAVVGTSVEYTPSAGYFGAESFTYTVSDGSLSSVGNVLITVDAESDVTVQLKSIPRQFVPIDGGGEKVLLSDYFSDADDGYPPYQVSITDTATATVAVTNGYLVITPLGIGVATTTLTVSDTPGIRDEFLVIVYRPVISRTDTETVHIVDPAVETTLTTSDSKLVVTFQAGSRDQFFQVAVDARSESCGLEAPIGHRRLCVLVDLFDLGAQSIEESLNLPATMNVMLDQPMFSTIQTDVASGEFSMWKGHGPEDVTWELMQQCPDPRGTDECYELTADENGNGGTITVYNIAGFSEFAAGSDQPAPPPTEPPTTTPPPTTGGGGSGVGSGGSGSSGSGSGSGSGSTRTRSSSEYQGNQTPQIFGRTDVTYSENGTDPVAEFEAEDADDDEITWSLLGYDRSKFEISQEGVLSFRSPPDYEAPQGRDGNTYRVILQAEDDGRPSEYDVHNVRVTVTQVNELGELTGDAELSLPENSADAITQYQVDDPEKGTITWTLSGPDAGMFQIDEQGNLSPAAALDFETPASSDETNVHSLKVTATDNGEPELSVDMDVSITITNVNEAPLVDGIPGVDLGSEDQPRLVDLSVYFTDPDGDDLGYDFSGDNITGVALAHLEDGTLSIDPVSGGEVAFYVVATDSGGLSAVTSISVSVTEPEPVPPPAPAVTVPVPVSTPAPVVVVQVPTPTVPEPVIIAPEPEPTFAPLPPLVERRIRNQTQESDSVSKVIVAFAIEPVGEPIAEVSLPPVAEPPAPQKTSPVDEGAAGHSPAPLTTSLDDDGGGLTIWLWLMLVLVAMVTGGYAVRMYVIHRL